MTAPREPVGRWDVEWAAEQAAAALRYLGRNAPEVLENTSVLEPHEEAAHQAAIGPAPTGAVRRQGGPGPGPRVFPASGVSRLDGFSIYPNPHRMQPGQ
jgi:hypothetical protein